MNISRTLLFTSISLSTFMLAGSSNVASAATPEISLVLNAADLTTDVAPGAAVLIFGRNFGTEPATGVRVSGKSAQVLSAQDFEWYVVIPNDAEPGVASVRIGDSAPFDITLREYAPALFHGPLSFPQIVIAKRGMVAVTRENPALPGDVISILATGLGTTDAAGRPAVTPVVTLNDQPVAVLDALISTPGTYQVSIRLSESLPSGNLPVALSIGGVTSTRPVALPVGSLTGPNITDVRNGASFLSDFSPGSWVTIAGARLAGTTRLWGLADFVGNALPTELDGVTVTINGKPAYVSYVSPGQLNVLAPADTSLTAAEVQVSYVGIVSNIFNATPAAVSPALFMFDQENRKYVAGVHSDGTYLGPAGLLQGAVSVPAHAGDVILLFGTGFGPTSPATPTGILVTTPYPTASTVTCTIGDVPATVQFAGLVAAGEYQFNIVVPSVPAGDRSVVLMVNGVTTQPNAFLAVQ